ncbi:MAG: pentapeptide repeat-containing protein [Coprobacillaceae bacterium]
MKIKIYIYSDANPPIEIRSNNFENIDLSGLNLHRAILTGKSLKNSKLIRTDFRSASMQYTDLSNCNLTNSRFTFSESEGINLQNSNMERCLANNCDFRKANFTNTNMKDIILVNSHLHGAIVLGLNIETANIKGVKFDQSTVWPEGYNPLEHGAIKEVSNFSNEFSEKELIEFAKMHINEIKKEYK